MLSSSRPTPKAPPGKRVDSHVHVWAPPELAATKYPYTAQLIGTTASAPPVDGSVPRLLAALEREAKASSSESVGALVVQSGCHQYDHSYLTDTLRSAPAGTLAGCLLADPSRGPEAGVAELRAVAALTREDDDSKRLYYAVRFNPYLWSGHAAEPAGVKSSSSSIDDDDTRMAGPTGRALFAAAGELNLPVCFMPFKGLLGVADDVERLMDLNPQAKVVIDHYGFCACSSSGRRREGGDGDDGGQQELLPIGRSEEWRRLLSWSQSRPQVYVKASAAMRASRQPFPHADAALWGVRALVDAFGAERVLWGTDWPWVEDEGTFSAARQAAMGAQEEGETDDGWRPYGYEGAWRLNADAAAVAGDDGPPAAPLTDEEAAWVFGGSACALFPGAWDD
jgi:predicted TIM-barrel fold metal-dependent hydrolase